MHYFIGLIVWARQKFPEGFRIISRRGPGALALQIACTDEATKGDQPAGVFPAAHRSNMSERSIHFSSASRCSRVLCVLRSMLKTVPSLHRLGGEWYVPTRIEMKRVSADRHSVPIPQEMKRRHRICSAMEIILCLLEQHCVQG